MLNTVIKTFLSKSGILVANFLLVILTTHVWGAEGRGIISILMADVAIITYANNIFGGGSISFHTNKIGIHKLIVPAYLWVVLITPVLAILINIIQHHNNTLVLMVLTALSSFCVIHQSIFIGKENFKWYNTLNFISPALVLVFSVVFVFVLDLKSVQSYYYAFALSMAIVLLLSIMRTIPYFNDKLKLSLRSLKSVLNYGWQSEFSGFIQFLNYRLSLYFILFYIGLKSVGIFSVGLALAESIWIIARSIAIVQYAQIINNEDREIGLKLTKSSAKLSLMLSLIISVILVIIPAGVYGFIFGQNFFIVKKLMIFLLPGIIFNAVSNIHGHYFSATGQTKILIYKSLIGLVFTIGFSLALIPKYGIIGGCIAASISYITSSVYYFVMFYRITKFQVGDFIFSGKDDLVNFYNIRL
jgi:O-antigen/teichoic acid export membrane protein